MGGQMGALTEQYLRAIEARIAGLGAQLPAIAAAAAAAAERACAGGRIWTLSDEDGFVGEYQYRAAGLMMMSPLPGDGSPPLDAAVGAGDAVLAATQHHAPERQDELLQALRERGVHITLIGASDSPLRARATAFIENGLAPGTAPLLNHDGAAICPAASTVNIAAGWLWALELANACHQRDRVPVFIVSGVLAAGADRNRQLHGKPFHDPRRIPGGAGSGRAAGPRVDRGVVALSDQYTRHRDGQACRDRRCCRRCPPCRTHGMVRIHRPQPAQPARHRGRPPVGFVSSSPSGTSGLPSPPATATSITATTDFRLTSWRPCAPPVCARPGSWGAGEIETIYPHPGEIHLDAYWRYGDASLHLPGYDYRVIPSSGVVTTAMLWLLHAAAADAAADS